MTRPTPRILVAGGTGFIGSAIARRLRADGMDVSIAARAAGIDLVDPAAVARLGRFDGIVHAACRASVPESRIAPGTFYRDHFLVTLNLLELARATGAQLVLASTYVYGAAPPVPVSEDAPARPDSPYAASRRYSELLCRDYHRDYGVPATVLRIFNAYGPGQRRDFIVPFVVAGALRGRIELAALETRRDFVHVDDIARAVALALERSGRRFDVFNVGTGTSHSLGELAERAARIADRAVEIVCSGALRGLEVPDARADASKAARVLDWRSRIGLDEGLAGMFRAESAGP